MIHPGDAHIKLLVNLIGVSVRAIHNTGRHGVAHLDVGHMQAITQGKAFEPRGIAPQADTVDGCRINVIDHPGVRAEGLNIFGTSQNGWKFTHGPEDTTRPNSVARTHANTIFLRNDTVNAAILDRLVGKTEDNKIGPR